MRYSLLSSRALRLFLSSSSEKMSLPRTAHYSQKTVSSDIATHPNSSNSCSNSDLNTKSGENKAEMNAGSMKKLLVLLDMNGTLILRCKPNRNKGEVRERSPDFCHSSTGMEYFLRPGAVELLSFLIRDERVKPVVLTSMMKNNASPALLELERRAMGESSKKKTVPDIPIYCGHGLYNVPDVNKKIKPWDTMRCLEEVWNGINSSNQEKYDGRNTIMIDDTKRKMRYHPFNVIKVSEFTERSLSAKIERELFNLQLYLKDLLEKFGGDRIPDVRTYLESNPYSCSQIM